MDCNYLGKPTAEGMECRNLCLVTRIEDARCEEEDINEQEEEEDQSEDVPVAVWEKFKGLAPEKKPKAWEPSNETFSFAGQEISIKESVDSFGALTWPGALALCKYLENNPEQIDLRDKAVLEIGAGTGLVSIVACLLGAWVTATDLPDILANLRFNLSRNTRGRCRYTPQVATLAWGLNLQRTFPSSIFHYDYVLAADVVYHHDCLDELLVTMEHFCRPGTTLIWSNKVRFETDHRFIERFKNAFDTTVLAEIPQEQIRIYKATFKK
ncbi:S-adenosylmethionine-dependent methyltransferase domain-containing protein [Sardina pilchardus]|uniref:S-adenosylmethionine-dependent methyltransferase domain-containing protein n=1 Tax=Sardina pilchardus TaxID=27697 RepID=UPI002E0D97B4